MTNQKKTQNERKRSGCTCGSGAHPRRCLVHPGAFEEHIRQLNEPVCEVCETTQGSSHSAKCIYSGIFFEMDDNTFKKA